MRNWLFAAVMSLAAATAISSVAADLETRKSAGGGVTVAVTPQNLAGDAKTWDFKVVLDTHSADLNDDLVKSSVLFDGAGQKYVPLGWDGAAPGGHHREGVLRFKPLQTRPEAIELQIMRFGELAPRSFRWQIR